MSSATLDVPVGVAVDRSTAPDDPAHRLVAIGDSLTHGVERRGVPRHAVMAAVLAADRLNSDPPALVDDLFGVIAPFAKRFVSRT